MRDAVLTMLKLQELELIREESRIVHRDKHQVKLNRLDESIKELRAKLPEQYLKRFDGLRRSGMAVAREFGGVCQSCRMVITIGDLNRMRKDEMQHICPNCGRFLLLSSSSD